MMPKYLIIIGQVLDVVTTVVGVLYLGMLESNWLYMRVGLLPVIALKLTILALLVNALLSVDIPKWAQYLMVFFSFLPFFWNTYQIIYQIIP